MRWRGGQLDTASRNRGTGTVWFRLCPLSTQAMFEGLRFNHWKTSISDDAIVTLTLDRANSAVNAISSAVLDELAQLVERLAIDSPAGVIIHSAKASGFAVGADIKEFVEYARNGTVLENIERGQRVFTSLSRLRCPTVAAIHGACMGGGTELALACGQRIAADDGSTRIALPEVMLGIHPGWGGTARLPYLIGATDALALMLNGNSLSARRALALGLVDRLARPEELLGEARQLLRHPHARALTLRGKVWLGNTWVARQILAPVVRKRTAAKVRKEHYPAPFALIDVWQSGGGDMQRRLRLEARSVARLAQTATAQNLIRIFFLRERLKNQGTDVDARIKRVHVVGAGVMGGDIAAWCALRGFDVTLSDRGMQYIQPALDRWRRRSTVCAPIPRAPASTTPTLHWRQFTRTAAPSASCMRGWNRNCARTISLPATPPAFRWTSCAPACLAHRISSGCISSTRWHKCRWWKSCVTTNWIMQSKSAPWRYARRWANYRSLSRARPASWSTAF